MTFSIEDIKKVQQENLYAKRPNANNMEKNIDTDYNTERNIAKSTEIVE